MTPHTALLDTPIAILICLKLGLKVELWRFTDLWKMLVIEDVHQLPI
jgi:hypothetical protein